LWALLFLLTEPDGASAANQLSLFCIRHNKSLTRQQTAACYRALPLRDICITIKDLIIVVRCAIDDHHDREGVHHAPHASLLCAHEQPLTNAILQTTASVVLLLQHGQPHRLLGSVQTLLRQIMSPAYFE
jgi:hypothetical protein